NLFMKSMLPILPALLTLAFSANAIQPPDPATISTDQRAAGATSETVQTAVSVATASDQEQPTNDEEVSTASGGFNTPLAQASGGGGGGFGGSGYGYTVSAGSGRLQNVYGFGTGHPGKTVVIRSSEPDPKEQTNLEEDLAVMAHILQKALEEKGGRGQAR